MSALIRKSFVLCFLCLWLPALAVDVLEFQSPQEEERFRALAEEIRCLVCQNQSLADSSAPLAQDLRREVLEQIHAGRSDQEIRDYLVARYSDFVLYRPSMSIGNLMLWFAPLLMVVGGLWVLIRKLKQPDLSESPPTTGQDKPLTED